MEHYQINIYANDAVRGDSADLCQDKAVRLVETVTIKGLAKSAYILIKLPQQLHFLHYEITGLLIPRSHRISMSSTYNCN